jgi:hypothetical protein
LAVKVGAEPEQLYEPLLPPITPVHERSLEPVKVAEPSTVSVTGNVLLLTVPVLSPAVAGHAASAACSCVVTVEVVGMVLAGARRNEPEIGDAPEQAFAVPLLPPEGAVTVVIPVKGVKVA